MVEIVPFDDAHLGGVLALCRAEGWPSLPADPSRALRALRAPGVTSYVGLVDDRVVGFAQLLSDGEIQAYLALLLVADGERGTGLGRRLVRTCLERAGGVRVDLLADTASIGFYERFRHRSLPGYRIYPLEAPERAAPGEAGI